MRLLFDIGSTLKEKNLLQEEQILSCKSLPLLRRAAKIVELLPVNVYSFILIMFISHIFALAKCPF